MKDDPPGKTRDLPDFRKDLEVTRACLLDLHKALVDSERVEYERTMGRIESPSHFLQLLTTDPWFVWLSPLSQLIVSMDETLDSREPLTRGAVEALLLQSNRLLVASDEGDGFSKHYFEALQRDPDVVLASAKVSRLRLKRQRPGPA